MVAAIDLDHGFDRFEFAREAGVALVRRRGRFWTEFVERLSRCIHLTALA
jgi:hypothetical protein